ncbi:MAG: CBS domain-containing protein [Pseudomonadota bacterium]
MKVEDILHHKGDDIFSVQATDTIGSAVDLLNDKNIGAVIVKNGDGSVCGILSERDVVRRMGGDANDAAVVLSCSVSECMTPNPFTCSPVATVDEVMTQMTQKRIRHLPVTDNGQLVGVISIGDVVKRKIEQAENEAAALKEYIAG